MQSPVDHTYIFAAIIAWNAMMTTVIVALWNRLNKVIKENIALERELSVHRASTELIERCPRVNCPLRQDDPDTHWNAAA